MGQLGAYTQLAFLKYEPVSVGKTGSNVIKMGMFESSADIFYR